MTVDLLSDAARELVQRAEWERDAARRELATAHATIAALRGELAARERLARGPECAEERDDFTAAIERCRL